MKIEPDIKLDFSDVLIRPKRSTLSSRSEVDLVREFKFPHSPQTLSCVPIIVSNMTSVSSISMLKACSQHKILTCLHKYIDINEVIDAIIENPDLINYCMLSTGISDKEYEKLQENLSLMEKKCKPLRMLTIDIANGYQASLVDFVKKIRAKYPDIILFCGNVVTRELVEELILSGADVIKVGLGSGAGCKTRTQTGVGIPQVSAVIESADSSHGLNGHIVSDGGICEPGCCVKAFAAGADFCMMGGVFSGHDECPGEIIEEDGKKFKEFYGMSSKTSMEKYHGGMSSYRTSEGRTCKVPYKGPVENTILNYLGGLRSAMTYVGAHRLKDLPKCTTFIRVNNQLNTVFSKYG